MRRTHALCVILLLGCATTGWSQNYSFSVPRMLLNVYVNPDASVTMRYEIDFVCSSGAHAIDIVDVGLPHKGYRISNMSAAVNGVDVSGIRKSTYVDIGVEVPLGSQSIAPGQSGQFTFSCTMPKLVYQDTTREDYASLQITPTWFDGGSLTGSTELGVVIYLPKDIEPDEILHQGDAFSAKEVIADHTIAAWYMSGVRVDGPHMVALSFPKRNMDRVVKMSKFGLLVKWFEENPGVRIIWGFVCVTLLGLIFFRASQGTGISIFVVLLVGAVAAFIYSGLLGVGVLSEMLIKRRRGHYLPAIASVEGGGAKRGLTAPEAGVLLEMPLGRVVTLVLFGLLKKGVLRQVSPEPLRVEVAPEYAGRDRRERRRVAGQQGTVLHGHEQPFIDAIDAHPGALVERIDFATPMKELISGTARKMKGSNVEESRDYYQYIVDRAWANANAITDPEERTKHTDENLPWLMAHNDRNDYFDRWHRGGYYYHPHWARTSHVGAEPSAIAAAVPETPVGGRTSFTDVADSFSGWTENLTRSLASGMDSVSVGARGSGLLDLSGVDRVTMDTLKALSEASSSGGGGGAGGCACACAGCACACACAGGGR